MDVPPQNQAGLPSQLLQCSWPELFSKRRHFSREAENQPYLETLATVVETYAKSEKSDSQDCDSSEEDSSEEDDTDYSSEDEDTTDTQKVKIRNDILSPDGQSKLRYFLMERGTSYFEKHHNQAEQVVRFCEQSGDRDNESRKTDKDEKPVALIDDRYNGEQKKYGRPYLGPLTSQQLGMELARQVT